MAKDKEIDWQEQQRNDLQDVLQSKAMRNVLWTHVIEPCGVIDKCRSDEPIKMAKFLARENIAKNLIENIKEVNLEAWFQMVRDNQFDEEGEQSE